MNIIVVRNALVALMGNLIVFDDSDFAAGIQFRRTKYGIIVTFGNSKIVIERYHGVLRFLAQSRGKGVSGRVTSSQLACLQSFLEEQPVGLLTLRTSTYPLLVINT
ncbi:MAG: hypothetical protein KBB55_03955 [Candidatus Buchananbacteria bacterium]|nr:hypothetical protein [Candidatus Buchananbacteria bacterium]